MNFRRWIIFTLASVALAIVVDNARGDEFPQRLHWLGLDRLSADTNAAAFLKIWRQPETARLINQTLDKLSYWYAPGNTNAAVGLRPLLDDLLASEFVLHWNSDSDRQFILAVRLPRSREDFWRTNLAAAFADWTGITPVFNRRGWVLAQTNPVRRIEFTQSGPWAMLGCGAPAPLNTKQFAPQLPAPSRSAPWLEMDLDLPALHLPHLISPMLSSVSHVHGTVTGRNGNLHTKVALTLAAPFTAPLPPWAFPTNLMHGPFNSFAAARGTVGWLAAQPAWRKLQLTSAPDQFVVWSRNGIPFQTYLAAPLSGASNQLERLSQYLIQNGNPWLAMNAEGSLTWNETLLGIVWNNANILNPTIMLAHQDQQEYILCGLYPLGTDAPALPPARILKAFYDQPDLVFGEFENTGSRVEDVLFISQWLRLTLHKSQMPQKAAGTLWLKNTEQQLGECTTLVTRPDALHLQLQRDSTVGFNAVELHLIADWLESPRFPVGLHTFLAPLDQQ